MSKGVFNVPIATNEPVKSYIKGSLERNRLLSTYKEMYNSNIEIPLYIGGEEIYTKNKKIIPDVVNVIAPEHLEIIFNKNKKILKNIKNAGSIFIGKFSPEAMGDYIAGPNHVLPTSGSAKFTSGLSVNDFLKRQSVIKITKSGIERLGPSVINLAKHEKLEGHANSIKIRIKKKG